MAKTRSSDQQYQKLQSACPFISCQGFSAYLGYAFISYFQQQSSSSLDLLKLWYQFINSGAETVYFVFSLSLPAYKNVEEKGGEKSISAICFLHFYHPIITYSCIIILDKAMQDKAPYKISINTQFHELFKKAGSQLKIERPSRIQPAKFNNHSPQEIYINDIKTFFRKIPPKMEGYNKLLLLCKDIIADCKLIDRKNFTFEQLNQYMPLVKSIAQEGRKLEIVKSQLRKIQELSMQKAAQYEKKLKSQTDLAENEKKLLLDILSMKKEPKQLNRLKNLELQNDSLLQNNRLIVDMFASIKARGVSYKDIEDASFISDKGLSKQLTLFLQFLQSYFVDLSKPESPFLKAISLLSQDKSMSDIKKYMDLLPKTQLAIIRPLVQKMTNNQKTSQQTGPVFELDKFKSSQNQLNAKIEELDYNLQIAESQKQEMINKKEQLELELEDQKREHERKIKSTELKFQKHIKKMSQQLEDYKQKLKELQNENSRLNNLHKMSQKSIKKQTQRDNPRITEENNGLRQRIRELEDRLDRQISVKQQQIDRILREKNEMARKISFQLPKNGEVDPLLLQQKGQYEQFTLQLDRQKENHTTLQQFLTKLQRQLRKNENEIISKLRANQKKARKNYSELEALNRTQIQQIKKLSAEISLEKEANRKAQELKAELNTLREQYNEMKENYMKMFYGDGQSYSVSQQQHLVRQRSKK